VVKVEDIEGRRESEISKLVKEIKDELKKLHEKSRSRQNLQNPLINKHFSVKRYNILDVLLI